MALDRTQANSILGYLHKASGAAAPRTITGPIMIRLMSAIGSAAANGTPISGTYGSAGLSAGAWTNTAASQQDANTAVVNFTSMPAATTDSIELWSSDGTPVRTEFGAITGGAKTTASGDTLSFAAGAITSTLA
jgi:hypothetical protein